jgi:glucose-1-phosphate adenylyltransferase
MVKTGDNKSVNKCIDRQKNIFLQNMEWRIHTVENNEPPLYLDEKVKVHHSLV